MSPGYYERGARKLSNGNRRKIEPKEIPSSDFPPTRCIYPATWNLSDNPALCLMGLRSFNNGIYVSGIQNSTTKIKNGFSNLEKPHSTY